MNSDQHIRSLIGEIHRRSLWQVLGVYAVASWIIYQVVVALWEGIGLPEWVPGTALVLLLIGLPIVLATAFVQEGAPGFGGSEEGGRPASVAGLETTADTVRATDRAADAPSAVTTELEGPGDATGERTGVVPTGGHRASILERRTSGLFTWSRAITGGVLAFAALGVAASGFMGMRALGIGPAATLLSSGRLEARDPVVLADFASLTGDDALARVVTEAFRADLAQSQMVKLANASDVAAVLERMGRDAGAVLDVDAAREVATRGGMKALIAGEVGDVGGRYVLTARVIGAMDGEVLLTLRETARDSTDVIPAIDRLAKATRERIGESLRSVRRSPLLIAITTPSLPALKKLVQAFDASNRGDDDRALTLLEEAIALDTAFAEAHRKRGVILNNRGRTTQALEAFERALAHADRLTDYERYHTRGVIASVTGDTDGAIAAYTALLDMNPQDTRALNNLGVAYVRVGEFRRAVDAYSRALAVGDSLTPGPTVASSTYTNLAGAFWNAGQPDSAHATLDRLERQVPTHPALTPYRAQFASAAGDYETAARLYRGDPLDGVPANVQWEQVGHRRLAEIEALQGRIRRAAPHFDEAIRINDGRGVVRDALVAGLRRALVEGLVLGDTAAATRTLAQLRARYDIAAAADVPLLLLTGAYAASGQVDSAHAALARLRAEPDRAHRSDPYALPAAEALVASAVGDHERAATLWARAVASPKLCPICFLPQLANALEHLGRTDEAIEAYTRYLETTWATRVGSIIMPDGDALYRAFVHERLAGLHEQRGDRARAAEHHRALIELWQDADPELQPRVEAARRALARFTRERGG